MLRHTENLRPSKSVLMLAKRDRFFDVFRSTLLWTELNHNHRLNP